MWRKVVASDCNSRQETALYSTLPYTPYCSALLLYVHCTVQHTAGPIVPVDPAGKVSLNSRTPKAEKKDTAGVMNWGH